MVFQVVLQPKDPRMQPAVFVLEAVPKEEGDSEGADGAPRDWKKLFDRAVEVAAPYSRGCGVPRCFWCRVQSLTGHDQFREASTLVSPYCGKMRAHGLTMLCNRCHRAGTGRTWRRTTERAGASRGSPPRGWH